MRRKQVRAEKAFAAAASILFSTHLDHAHSSIHGEKPTAFPCREISAIACQPSHSERFCQSLCENKESKIACRETMKCDDQPTKQQIRACNRECKEASPRTCRIKCMSEYQDILCRRNQRECWELAESRNKLSEQGLNCGETYELCKDVYMNSCVESRCLDISSEQSECEGMCERESHIVCKPGKRACKRTRAINLIVRRGDVDEEANSCTQWENPKDCFCDYEANRIDYSTATRKSFEAWCITPSGDTCGFYKCPECAAFGIPPENCFIIGSVRRGGGLYQQQCPPGPCDGDGDAQELDESKMVWCSNGPDSIPCLYQSKACIPDHVFHPAECKFGDSASIIKYECPKPKDRCNDCSRAKAVCYTGTTECFYCSWDCIPTGSWPDSGFGEDKNLFCDEVPMPV